MRKTLLAYVATRYEEAHATSDELRQRALELIVAACVTEWRHSPDEVAPPPSAPSPSPEPGLEWSEDDVPKIDYDDLASRLEVQEVDSVTAADEPDPQRVEPPPERTEESVWWTSPEQPDPTPPPAEPMRGAWEPPRRS